MRVSARGDPCVADGSDLLACYTRGQPMELSSKFTYRPAVMRFSKDDEALLARLMSHIPVKPEGVGLNYAVTTVDGSPVFGFDMNNSQVAGWDTGAWAAAS